MKKWGAVLILSLGLLGAGLIYRDLRQAYRGYSGAIVVTVSPGMRSPDVTNLLVARGVLHHRLPFFAAAAFGRARHRLIKAGEYLFDRPLTPLQVYRKLVSGDVYVRTVLIPEGSDRFDMARIFQEQLGLSPVEFLRATQVTGPVHDLDPQAPSLEGFLFPDTYRFPLGTGAGPVVTAMLSRFRDVLNARIPEIHQSPRSLHDLLTLASLVERETPVAAERPLVAGVFSRRLEKGMMLQCDPSVVYAQRLDRLVSAGIEGAMNLNIIAPASDPLTDEELRIDSPYNTYTHAGLPRGPICSPGEASIRAALNPAVGGSLYFVSNNQGGHLFASTLAEHNRNVTRYRRQAAATVRNGSDPVGGGASGESAGGQSQMAHPGASPSKSGALEHSAPEERSGGGAQPAPEVSANRGESRVTRHRVKRNRRTPSKQEQNHP